MSQPVDIGSLDGAGRVTIPKQVRDRIGLKEGDTVFIFLQDRGVSLIPATEVEIEQDSEDLDQDSEVDSKIDELEIRISALDSGDFAPAK